VRLASAGTLDHFRSRMNIHAPIVSVQLIERFKRSHHRSRNFVIKVASALKEISFQTRELDKLLYSVSEAAYLLSCSRNTVYALIKSGQILAVYPTSKARITASSLRRFVEQKELDARSERHAQRAITR